MAQRARALDRQRQRAAEPAGDAARAGPSARRARCSALLDAVPRVAGPQLVAAVAGQRDGDELARRLRHVVGRHRRRIGERLVEVPRQLRQQRSTMSGVTVQRDGTRSRDAARRVSRVRELVVAPRGRSRPTIVTGGRGARLDHVGDDRGRVDAAGEERAERHVADQPQRDGLAQRARRAPRGSPPRAPASPSPVNSRSQ